MADAAEKLVDEESLSDEPPKRKRGRPPGTGAKGPAKAPPKQKIGMVVPPEMAAFVAQVPLELSVAIAGMWHIKVVYEQPERQITAAVFQEWLKTVDFDLSPGIALLLVYTAVIAAGVGRAVIRGDSTRLQVVGEGAPTPQ